MAKRRRVKSAPPQPPAESNGSGDSSDQAAPLFSGVKGLDPISIAVGLLGAAVIYTSYYPSDSVSVERGDALWFTALAIGLATIVWAVAWWFGTDADDAEQSAATLASRSLDIVPWLLAAWMMLAAFATSPPGNLRMATNEAWFWVAAAAVFTSSRRLMASLRTRQAMMVLMLVCATGLAVHGLHQQFVSLPANRGEYQQDPERVLELAGIDAPPGSAERMVFENRLFDGGPTGTFALANSLAAVLLVGVILAVGALRFHWNELDWSRRVAWGLAALLCASCLLSARSRSATLAMLVGLALLFVASSRIRERNPKALRWGLAGVSLFGIVVAIFIALVGNREWFEEAPASLAFRFQYWRSTWHMVLDHPLFGAGPGNFQSIYERYREASATEQIAEPHNLFFETLAAGGFVGLGLLLLGGVAAFVIVTSKLIPSPSCGLDAAEGRDRWLWLGAILSVLMVWLIGWASRQTPDNEASWFVLPVSVATAILLGPSIQRLADRDLDSIVGVALIAILIHLLVAGGWTVPGVAMIVWLCAAMLTRKRQSLSGETHQKPMVGIFVVACGVVAFCVLYVMSLRPVETQKHLMATTAMARSMGQVGKARVTLELAVESDPWSPDAMLWLADVYRWKLVLESNDPESRRQWERCLSEAKRRGGDDPALYRMVGAQQLHVYQRHGAAKDLAAAAETFGKAVDWSPSNQWLMAQMAVVASASGEMDEAKRLGRRAVELSHLGGNIERALSRQQVYVPRFQAVEANRGPIRQPADQLLPEPNNAE